MPPGLVRDEVIWNNVPLGLSDWSVDFTKTLTDYVGCAFALVGVWCALYTKRMARSMIL